MHLADVNRAFELMKSGRVARSLLDFESAKRSEPEGRESGGRAPSRRVEATGSPLRPRRNHAVASGRAALAPGSRRIRRTTALRCWGKGFRPSICSWIQVRWVSGHGAADDWPTARKFPWRSARERGNDERASVFA